MEVDCFPGKKFPHSKINETSFLPQSVFQTKKRGHLFNFIDFAGFPSRAFQRHLKLCNLDMKQFYSDQQDVERVSANELSYEEFLERFIKKNKPVIITDAMEDWPANVFWSQKYLVEECGQRKFLTDEVERKGEKLKMTMRDYYTYAALQKDEDPIYLFDPKLELHSPELLCDFFPPKYFSEDLFQGLSSDERPFFRWLIIGHLFASFLFNYSDTFFFLQAQKDLELASIWTRTTRVPGMR